MRKIVLSSLGNYTRTPFFFLRIYWEILRNIGKWRSMETVMKHLHAAIEIMIHNFLAKILAVIHGFRWLINGKFRKKIFIFKNFHLPLSMTKTDFTGFPGINFEIVMMKNSLSSCFYSYLEFHQDANFRIVVFKFHNFPVFPWFVGTL
jgi:hypothetical protein